MKEDNKEYGDWLTTDMWCRMDPRTTDFAFEQGEKYLSQLEETAKAITNRCYWILGLFSAICPLLIAAFFTIENIYLAFVCFVFIGLCLILSVLVLKIVLPKEGYLLGRDPNGMLSQCNWDDEAEDGSAIKYYELINLQAKIEEQKEENKRMANRFSLVLWIFFGSLFLFLILALLFR